MKQTKQERASSHQVPHDPGEAGGMPDMPKSHEDRNIALDTGGVKEIRYPTVVKDRCTKKHKTVARIHMFV